MQQALLPGAMGALFCLSVVRNWGYRPAWDPPWDDAVLVVVGALTLLSAVAASAALVFRVHGVRLLCVALFVLNLGLGLFPSDAMSISPISPLVRILDDLESCFVAKGHQETDWRFPLFLALFALFSIGAFGALVSLERERMAALKKRWILVSVLVHVLLYSAGVAGFIGLQVWLGELRGFGTIAGVAAAYCVVMAALLLCYVRARRSWAQSRLRRGVLLIPLASVLLGNCAGLFATALIVVLNQFVR